MQIYMGSTPTITTNIKSDVDLSTITQIWWVISQQNKEKIVKEIEDCIIDSDKKTISVRLSQENTLSLREGDAIFQMRILLSDDNALVSPQIKVTVKPVNKKGVITNG